MHVPPRYVHSLSTIFTLSALLSAGMSSTHGSIPLRLAFVHYFSSSSPSTLVWWLVSHGSYLLPNSLAETLAMLHDSSNLGVMIASTSGGRFDHFSYTEYCRTFRQPVILSVLGNVDELLVIGALLYGTRFVDAATADVVTAASLCWHGTRRMQQYPALFFENRQ